MQVIKLDGIPSKDINFCRKFNIAIGIHNQFYSDEMIASFVHINEFLAHYNGLFDRVCRIRDVFTDVQPQFYTPFRMEKGKRWFYIKNKDYSDRFYENPYNA